MSQPSVNAVTRAPTVVSLGRVKRSYLLATGAPTDAASNDSSYQTRESAELAAWARRAQSASGFGDASVARESVTPAAPVSAASHRRSEGFTAAVSDVARFAIDATHRAAAAWRRHRDLHATAVALRALDARTLRDLGFDPSETGSVAMELHGRAAPTRMHTLMQVRLLHI
ncbi:MAG TPA: DUF1127 domain-containing protein [Burkholderiaceae bacterium]|nr:DUF1127 domain-containing protein [Burkholderiaceae bacterium]